MHISNRFSEGQKKLLVDIDETISFYPEERQYDKAEPIIENIAKINQLAEEGWYVTYWTARGSKSGINHYDLTKKQLEEWSCKYHQLRVGDKPPYDLLICDKSRRIEEI